MNSLILKPGEKVYYKGKNLVLLHILSLEKVLLINESTKEVIRATIPELSPPQENAEETLPTNHRSTEYLSEEEWATAKKRFQIIQPLVEGPHIRTTESVISISYKHGISTATLYRWIASYERSGKVSSLLRSPRNDKGESRLSKESEVLMEDVIENYYLVDTKRSIKQTHKNLERLAKRAKIPVPSYQTLLRRINTIEDSVKVEKRFNREKRRAQYEPIKGKYEEAAHPLSIVQIDHTPVDLMLVDEDERECVGRAWLTVAICVYSRMVCGYYVTYERPSIASVGLCLLHSILPKENWLSEKEIDAQWPIWGVMSNLHADNAAEFRSKTLDRAAYNYGININWRPLGRSDFGGHIERLLGTFNTDIHSIEGTTFSNTAERGRYKSEQKAIMTLNEFDKWLGIYITKIYHQTLHRGIGMSPIAKLEEGYFGDEETLGHGLPDKIVDSERLKIDFLPSFERSVQRYGIELDTLVYFHPCLTKWIKVKNPKSEDGRGKYIVKRDPRDVSKVYFLDPDLDEYFEIPCRKRSAPCMSLWELNEIKKHLKQKGESNIDEDIIFRGREELAAIEENAKKKTLKQRRMKERKKQAKRAIKKIPENTVVSKTDIEDDIFNQDISTFDDLQD